MGDPRTMFKDFKEIQEAKLIEDEFVLAFFEANKPRKELLFAGHTLDINMNLRMTYLDTKTGYPGEMWSTLIVVIAWSWRSHHE